MTEQFVIEGIITDKSKGVYNRLAKYWEIAWTVQGKAGKWELDAPRDTERTITFKTRGPGQRYRIARDILKVGRKVTVFGYVLDDGLVEYEVIN